MSIMTKLHAKRLLKLADRLESVPRKQFDMATYFTETYGPEPDCGTAACALGWACTMPEFKRLGLGLKLDYESEGEDDKTERHFTVQLKPRTGGEKARCDAAFQDYNRGPQTVYEDERAGMALFGLTDKEASSLFHPWSYPNEGKATPKQVAKKIRSVVKTHYPDLLRKKTAA